MKTAISLPDPLFRQAEAAARKMKVSRSQLYANALEEFLRHRETEAIIRRVREVCAREGSPLDPALEGAQFQVLERENW